MKSLLTIWLFSLGVLGFSADLEADVTAADPGEENGEVDLNVSGGVGPYTYSWVGPDGFVSTSEDLTGVGSGIYTVTVTDQYCGVATLVVEVGVQNYSILDENEGEAIAIYPNPTQDWVYVQSDQPVQVEVYTAAGQKVMGLSSKQSIDLSDQAPGTYFIHIHTEDAVLIRKVMLQ